MCIICISPKGAAQPNKNIIAQMFKNNPHGAGYMYVKNNNVVIHKGFMHLNDFTRAIEREKFTDEDTVIYHFRISTQAGICAEMTHPFPLTADITKTRALDVNCAVGVAHNGIIKMTSDSVDKIYNDTAHFVAKYMTKIIRNRADFNSEATKTMIEQLTHSKWAIINKYGDLMTVGNFIESDGNLYSNLSFMDYYQYSFRF